MSKQSQSRPVKPETASRSRASSRPRALRPTVAMRKANGLSYITPDNALRVFMNAKESNPVPRNSTRLHSREKLAPSSPI